MRKYGIHQMSSENFRIFAFTITDTTCQLLKQLENSSACPGTYCAVLLSIPYTFATFFVPNFIGHLPQKTNEKHKKKFPLVKTRTFSFVLLQNETFAHFL
jgi:hypothetical protein